MRQIEVDKLILKVKNKFLLVNATIMRAKQIQAGSLPYVDDFDPTDSITTALKEITTDKIKVKLGKTQIKLVEFAEEEAKERPSLAKEDKKVKTVKAKKK